MDRRIALKNLAVILGGAALFPSNLVAGGVLIRLKNLQLTPQQEKLLAEVAETIIPETNTPGAKDMSLHLFVLLMLDDCYSKQDQDEFMAGFKQFSELTAKRNTTAFAAWPKADREALLLDIEQNQNHPAELKKFYRITKDKTVQGYTQSQYFMTKQVVYELVPGRYLVNVPVNKTAKPAGK